MVLVLSWNCAKSLSSGMRASPVMTWMAVPPMLVGAPHRAAMKRSSISAGRASLAR